MPKITLPSKTADLYIEVYIYIYIYENVCVELMLIITNRGQHSCLLERQIHPSTISQFILGRNGSRKEATVGSFTDRERQVAFLCRIEALKLDGLVAPLRGILVFKRSLGKDAAPITEMQL